MEVTVSKDLSTYEQFQKISPPTNSFKSLSTCENIRQVSTASTESAAAAAAAARRPPRRPDIPAPAVMSIGTSRRHPGFVLHPAELLTETACTRVSHSI